MNIYDLANNFLTEMPFLVKGRLGLMKDSLANKVLTTDFDTADYNKFKTILSVDNKVYKHISNINDFFVIAGFTNKTMPEYVAIFKISDISLNLNKPVLTENLIITSASRTANNFTIPLYQELLKNYSIMCDSMHYEPAYKIWKTLCDNNDYVIYDCESNNIVLLDFLQAYNEIFMMRNGPSMERYRVILL